MAERYIRSAGAYLPLLRLERRAGVAALRWSGLGGMRSGSRAVAGWDEDAVTLSAEAARTALSGLDPGDIGSVCFASTSAPFHERQHSSLLAAVLGLGASVHASDVAGSRRCAVAALGEALGHGTGQRLIAAGDSRPTQAGSPLQLAWGDGGAAVLVAEKGCARLLGAATMAHDLVDMYASRAHPMPYQAEERFVRDVAISDVLAPTIAQALTRAGLAASDIDVAVVHEPVGGTYKALAARLGITADNVAETVSAAAGDLGAAHVLFALALALERAKPGDRLLVAGFGSGCDALVMEVTADIGTTHAGDALTKGQVLSDYHRFLSLTGSLTLDWGARGEFEQKISPSVLQRYGRDMLGFVGGRDAGGNVQFPKTAIPVSPDQGAAQRLVDVRLADVPACIVSITVDRLNYTPDPPFHFGLVQFDNGARVLMEFTDVAETPKVGDPLGMRFRVKSIDRTRGFRNYFWKAAPVERPLLEAA